MRRRGSLRERAQTSFGRHTRWLVLALVSFPVGRWLIGRVFPDDGSTRSLVGISLLLLVAVAWTVKQQRRGD